MGVNITERNEDTSTNGSSILNSCIDSLDFSEDMGRSGIGDLAAMIRGRGFGHL